MLFLSGSYSTFSFPASIWYVSMEKVEDFRALGEVGGKDLQSRRSEMDVNKSTSALSTLRSL